MPGEDQHRCTPPVRQVGCLMIVVGLPAFRGAVVLTLRTLSIFVLIARIHIPRWRRAYVAFRTWRIVAFLAAGRPGLLRTLNIPPIPLDTVTARPEHRLRFWTRHRPWWRRCRPWSRVAHPPATFLLPIVTKRPARRFSASSQGMASQRKTQQDDRRWARTSDFDRQVYLRWLPRAEPSAL